MRLRLAFAMVILLPAASAAAHGRPLGVNQLFRIDGQNVLFTTRGPVVEGDDGVYRWTCSQAYGDTGQTLIPNLARTTTGTLLAGSIAGLYRRPAGGCEWMRATNELQFVYVADVFALPVAGARIFAVTGDPIPDNYIAHSDDDGATFTMEVVEGRMQSVRVAPSDPDRVFVAGFRPGATPIATPDGLLLWSETAGVNFETLSVPLLEGERTLVITHVSSANPSRVYLRTVTTRQPESPPERLLRVDAALGVITNMVERRQLRGAADAGANGDVWVIAEPEGDVGGLVRITESGAITVRDATLNASCVLEDASGLYVCPIPRTGSATALMRSTDGGQSFVSLLDFRDVTVTDGCTESVENISLCVRDLGDIARDSLALAPLPPDPPPEDGCNVLRPDAGRTPFVLASAIVAIAALRGSRQIRRRAP